MKKIICFTLTLILLLSAAACSAKAPQSDGYGNGGAPVATPTPAMDAPAPAEMAPEYETDYQLADSGATSEASIREDEIGMPPGVANTGANISAEKIIYSATAGIETTAFDKTVESVYAMLPRYGSFIESANVTGVDYETRYYENPSYRRATFVIRVPKDSFEKVTKNLSDLGNVTYLNTNAQNITATFIDTESRLNAYKTEESRLLSFLEKTDTVKDMIEIESRLADVRYEIESLTSTLRNYSNQVDFSNVTLEIMEVQTLSKATPSPQLTYWQQISAGLSDTLRGVGDFFKALFKHVLVYFPIYLILAVLIALPLVILRKCGVLPSRKTKKAQAQEAAKDDKTTPSA